MRKYNLKVILPIVILLIAYASGPAPKAPLWNEDMPSVPLSGDSLESYIQHHEQEHKIKPDNESHIVWFNQEKEKTEYSVVYLHGFSASPHEGSPVHLAFAKKFGCNLYLPRLADHGIDTVEQLLNFNADRLWSSAKEALAVGRAIGRKVILMSSSTGGSMALLLAATYPDQVYALINMSPNIAINDPFAFVLNNPWGLQIARLVKGGNYVEKKQTEEEAKYWYSKYRLEAAVQLQELLESKMTKATFERVEQPSLTLYYYKNEQEQDPVVKVDAILKMNELLGTPKALKWAVPIPHAGTHVIGSSIESKDTMTVIQEINKFAQNTLKMMPLD